MFENLSADIVHAQPPRAESVDLATLLESAFHQPLFYPSIDQWLFPGDSLAIVLQSNLPNAVEVLEQIINLLCDNGVDTGDVVVVVTASMAPQFGITALQQQQSESDIATGTPPAIIKLRVGERAVIAFQVHDPANGYGLAYLAANEAGDPVHVNRLLADADVLLPVGCPTPGDQQRYDCLYPDFGSADRYEQFKTGAGSITQRTDEIELANNYLGTFFSLQIVSAPGDQIASVVAGARKDAIIQSKELADQLWAVNFVANCKTVLATIEEQSTRQSWDDFADAVVNAAHVSNGDGPIVLWTSIDQAVDRNTRKALLAQFDDNINTKLSVRQRALASIVSERPIFLRSRLSQAQTEELGLGFIESENDVDRILAKFDRCVMLRDAHRCCIIHPSPASS